MVIENHFIKLDYNPATDILLIDWPNIHDYTISELKYILDEIIYTIKNYDIKKVLADTTKSVVTLPEDDYQKLLNQFASNLTTTRIQKFARISNGQIKRDTAANKAADTVKNVFTVKSFSSHGEALAWLNSQV